MYIHGAENKQPDFCLYVNYLYEHINGDFLEIISITFLIIYTFLVLSNLKKYSLFKLIIED